jgi:hypothetical protein
MNLETKRETIYHGMGRGASKRYFVYIGGERVGDGETKEQAQQAAARTLRNAHEYLTRSCIAKVANNGTVIVFRQIADDQAMYEFCRDNGQGGSCCMGKMSDGWSDFRTLAEYADYVVARYNESTARNAA